MPREILTVSVGQAGNQIAWRFWDMLVREHAAMGTPGIYDDGMSTFFENVRDDGDASSSGLSMGKPFAQPAARRGARPAAPGAASGYDYASLFASAPLKALRARAVLVDMEEGVVNQVLRSPIGDLFDRTSQLITDVSGAGNNWAAGFHGYGPVYGGAVMEKVRRALEACDSPQSFLLLHSTGGGTGSGLGSRILATLADEFPEMYRFATSVFPSEDDDVVTSPYNFALAFNELAAHADCVLPLENQALLDVSAAVEAGLRKLARGPGGGGSALASASAVASARQSSLTFIPPPPMRASRLLYDSRPVAPLWSASSSRSVAGSLAGSRASTAAARSSDDALTMRPRPRSSAAGAGSAPVERAAPRQPQQLTVLSSASEGALQAAPKGAGLARPSTGAAMDARSRGEPPSASAAATPLKGAASSRTDRPGSAAGSPAMARAKPSPAAAIARGRAGAASGSGSHVTEADADDSVASAGAGATPSRAGRAASAGAVPRSRNLGHVAVGILPGMATKPPQRRATRSKPPTTTSARAAGAAGGAGARGTGSRIFHDDTDDFEYRDAGPHGGSAEDSYHHDDDALPAGDDDTVAPPEAEPVLSSLAAADAAIARALAIAAANSESKDGEGSSSKPLAGRRAEVGIAAPGPSGSAASRPRVPTGASTAAASRAGVAGAGRTAAPGRQALSSAALPPRAGGAGPAGRGIGAESAAEAAAIARGPAGRGGSAAAAATVAGKRDAASAAAKAVAPASVGARSVAAMSTGGRGAAAAAAATLVAADSRHTAVPDARAVPLQNPFIRLLQKRAADYGDADGHDDDYRGAPSHRDSAADEGYDAFEGKHDGGSSGASGGDGWPAGGASDYVVSTAAEGYDDRGDDDRGDDDGDDDDGVSASGGLKRGRKGTAFDSMNNLAAHLLTNLTASMRFEGPLNVDLNEITSTLVPFPRMHLLQSSVSPLFVPPDTAASMGSGQGRSLDMMYSQAFARDSQLIRGDPRRAAHLACGLLARGDVQLSDVTRNVDRLKRELTMARWNPDGFKVGICSARPLFRPYALLALSNNTSVVPTLTAAHARFMSLYRVRAHIHHYTAFMEEADISAAASSLTDMISSYNESESVYVREADKSKVTQSSLIEGYIHSAILRLNHLRASERAVEADELDDREPDY